VERNEKMAEKVLAKIDDGRIEFVAARKAYCEAVAPARKAKP